MDKVLLPFLFLAVSAGLFFTYIQPGFDSISAIKAQEVELTNAITKSQSLKKQRESLLTAYNNISQSDMARLEKILPDNLDIVRMVIELDAMASKNNVRIDGFDVPGPNQRSAPAASQQAGGEDKVGSATLTVELSGSYSDFKRMLHDVESSLLLSDIVKFEVDAEREDKQHSGEGEVTYKQPSYSLGLRAYWLK